MKLISNFSDYYDYAFDGRGVEFRRMNDDSGPSKREQFRILKEAGHRIPDIGTARELLSRGHEKIVVYRDEKLHCGEGKDLLTAEELRYSSDDVLNLFASQFIGKPGHSVRKLRIGAATFWIEYESKDSWMSNCGDGDCGVMGFKLDGDLCLGEVADRLEYPLYAIDFVLDREAYAVDLNIAPGIMGSGVEKFLNGRQVYNLLKSEIEFRGAA